MDTKTKLQKEEHNSKALYETKGASLQQEKHKLEEPKAYLETENDQMKKYINELKNRLDSDYSYLQKQLHRKENELTETELELENATTRMRKISEDNARKNYEIEKLQTSLANVEQKFQQTMKDAKVKTKQFESENSNLVSEHNKDIFKLQQKINDSRAMYETQITNLKDETRTLEVCKVELESKNDKMKGAIIKLENGRERNQKSARYSDSDYDALQMQLLRREKELKEMELKLVDTKTRLSECMGDKLTNNNPNIVDLSDMNRPSKLADRYKELYDNQWIDAYEILENSGGIEEQIIRILLNVLIETKRVCDDQTRMEMNAVLRAITHNNRVQVSDVPAGVLNYIKDCRQSSAAEIMKVKYKEYCNEMRRGSFAFAKQALSVNEYLNECFEICWLMSIQDRPVVLSPLLKHGDSFRTDLYCAYTVSGKIVDYSVWPALLLHENGPILTKGVAQGMKRT